MRVVVGNALKTQTPVLMAEMHFIDFMPYWNVPYSIVKNELLPKLIQNNKYLEEQNMELVSVFQGVEKPTEFSHETINLLKEGTLRIRQRPGGKNALGRVKFIFPNKEDVYLHDTPSNSLFSRSRRDFSHGCVRVANPQKLAEFALKNQDTWNEETIKTAMNTPKMQRVILKKPIPVLFFYLTAFFDQYDNLEFYPDLYGHDAALLEALSKPIDLSDQSLFISSNTVPEEITN
jgi:murein L,D-transpeptidase YcbB/YkuD